MAKGKRVAEPARPARERFTAQLDRDLIERVRRTVISLQGPPEFATISGFAAEALARECARLERKHNSGEPFPDHGVRPRPGRPPKR